MALALSCPAPVTSGDVIEMGHGSGGSMSHRLIREIAKVLGGSVQADTDAAYLPAIIGETAETIDSFVVRPLFFPGGDIGDLAVIGSANDLAVSGAEPLYLSVAMILEEGLPLEVLLRIVASMRDAAKNAGVKIVTGDTKVVERRDGPSGLTITTHATGRVIRKMSPRYIREGDAVMVSGDVGRHGFAIMQARGELDGESDLETDCMPLWPVVRALIKAGVRIRVMRDLTRGGLASGLCELAESRGHGFDIKDPLVPVSETVNTLAEGSGLDPWHAACEGRFIAVIDPRDVEIALSVCREFDGCESAEVIGTVTGEGKGVVKETNLKTRLPVRMLAGAQFPRIC